MLSTLNLQQLPNKSVNQEFEYNNRLGFREYISLSWGEPYRLLFPLGILIGLLGVAMWPLYYSGWISLPFPVPHHAHIMIQGFFGSFVFGFLGTAMPRMLTAPKLKAIEVGCIIVLITQTFHKSPQAGR
jgi:uncharacterized protein involved in response to NO